MERVLNEQRDSPELLATFLDGVHRGRIGTEKITETRAEAWITDVTDMLPYLTEKDMFREHYWQQLARRLLQEKSVSGDLEASAISRLKALCGPQFTHKIEDLMGDMSLAGDARKTHSGTSSASVVDGASLGVLTLKAACWPRLYMFSDVVLPPAMKTCMARFKEYFLHHHPARTVRSFPCWVMRSGRVSFFGYAAFLVWQLMWAMGHGTAEVSIQFSETVSKVVAGTTLQILILLLFNGKPSQTVREIGEASGIQTSSLRNVLGSMLFAKDLMILRKQPRSKVIDENDVVEIDGSYKNGSMVSGDQGGGGISRL